jgi:hypothetical protein
VKHGDIITVKGKYRRINKSVQTGLSSQTHKVWVLIEKEITGIFLGTRTLANGRIKYDHEFGVEFYPLEHFKVALISPSERFNPVYAPIPIQNGNKQKP